MQTTFNKTYNVHVFIPHIIVSPHIHQTNQSYAVVVQTTTFTQKLNNNIYKTMLFHAFTCGCLNLYI